MNWDDLQTVLAVARAGTLSGAASVLGVNHTTVSRRIRSFESEAGIRLFDKSAHGLVPTEAGADVVAAAEQMEDQALEIESRVLGRDTRLRGRVRLSTFDRLAQRYAAVFTGFTQEYPEVDLEISTDVRFANLHRREADVVLRSSNAPNEHLVGRRIGRAEYAVYGAAHLVAAMGRESPLADYPWITWDPRYEARMTERWMQAKVPQARIAAYVDSAAVFFELVRQGLGIAHLQVVDGEAEAGLVRLRDREPGWGMDLWLLTHPDTRATARIRAFTEHVGTSLAATLPALVGESLPWAPP